MNSSVVYYIDYYYLAVRNALFQSGFRYLYTVYQYNKLSIGSSYKQNFDHNVVLILITNLNIKCCRLRIIIHLVYLVVYIITEYIKCKRCTINTIFNNNIKSTCILLIYKYKIDLPNILKLYANHYKEMICHLYLCVDLTQIYSSSFNNDAILSNFGAYFVIYKLSQLK